MLNVALTGNVAAGKSTVARVFADLGATVIDADEIVRDLQQPGTPVFDAIRERFGAEVIGPDGTLDRAALRRRVLAEPAERDALNRIVHPAVQRRRAELIAAARARGDAMVINDIPLLFEAADPDAFDAVVLVDAPPDVRRQRLVRERGLSDAEADALIAAQLPSALKRPRSTFIIDNTDTLDTLRARAREVWGKLLDLRRNAG